MESMETNVGTIDRVARVIIALIILVILVRSGKVSFMSALSLIAGGMLLASASSGVCTLYTQLGISTAKNG